VTFLVAILLAQAAQHPCMDDAKKLCPGMRPGQGRIAACLKAHEQKVSRACKARMAEFREGAQACVTDVEKLCPGTKPGAERHQCMQEHKDQVSPECRQLFAQAVERHGELREAIRACRADAEKFCKDVKPGEGRIAQCLKQHQGELSRECAARMP
jgi:cysteine rich repeat protein